MRFRTSRAATKSLDGQFMSWGRPALWTKGIKSRSLANQRNAPFAGWFDHQTDFPSFRLNFSRADNDPLNLALSSVTNGANSSDNLPVATLFIVLHNPRNRPAKNCCLPRYREIFVETFPAGGEKNSKHSSYRYRDIGFPGYRSERSMLQHFEIRTNQSIVKPAP